MAPADFILTLDSEPEDNVPSTSSPRPKAVPAIKKTKSKKAFVSGKIPDDELGALDPEFNFDVGGGLDNSWTLGPENDVVTSGTKPVSNPYPIH